MATSTAPAALARAAAPYLHPRHAALRLDQSPFRERQLARTASPAAPHLLTDAQLDLLLDDARDDAGDAGGGQGAQAERALRRRLRGSLADWAELALEPTGQVPAPRITAC